MPSSPCRTMGGRGARSRPLFCRGTCGWRGNRVPGSGHVGALAGRDPAPPGNRSAAGLTAATCPHSAPATRLRHFSFQLSWQ